MIAKNKKISASLNFSANSNIGFIAPK